MWWWAKVAYVDQRELWWDYWWVANPGLSGLITLFTASDRHTQVMMTRLVMMMLMKVLMILVMMMMMMNYGERKSRSVGGVAKRDTTHTATGEMGDPDDDDDCTATQYSLFHFHMSRGVPGLGDIMMLVVKGW